MNILRTVAIGLIVVLAVPLIWMSISASNPAPTDDIMVSSNTPAVVAPETRPAPAPVRAPDPVDPATWLRNRADLRDTYNTTELNAARIVIVEEIIDDDALLAADETAPSDTFRHLYAAARAPARLISYCSDVVQTIGTKCDVIHSDVRENAQGKLEFTGHLAFIPAAALGDPSQVSDGAIVQGTITLPYDGDLKPANDSTTRAEALQKANAMCDTLREQYGNCVLTNVTFDIEELWITDLEVLPAGTNPQRLQTKATFQVYANRATLTQNKLLDQLRDLMGS